MRVLPHRIVVALCLECLIAALPVRLRLLLCGGGDGGGGGGGGLGRDALALLARGRCASARAPNKQASAENAAGEGVRVCV